MGFLSHHCTRLKYSLVAESDSTVSKFCCIKSPVKMATNILSASSPDGRRNISSLLNPTDHMDNPANARSSPQLEVSPRTQQPQQIPQEHQTTGILPIIHTGATHQSHLYPPLPPDHPVQVLVQSAAEPNPNSFRLTRASWGGDGPPPEESQPLFQKRLSDGIEG